MIDWMDAQWLAFVGSRAALSLCFKKNQDGFDALAERIGVLRQSSFSDEIKTRFLDAKKADRSIVVEVLEELVGQSVSAKDVLASLSHTKDFSIFVACEGNESLKKVGVDVENIHRTVSAKASARFLHESERQFKLNPLELWVIKEACYKAAFDNEKTVISQYRVLNAHIEGELELQVSALERRATGRVGQGDQEFDFCLVRANEWLIAFAKNSNN